MGGIWFRGREFIAALSETVGYKTGLAVDEELLRAIVDKAGYGEYWPYSDDVVMRVRSEEFAELFAGVLHHFGGAARWVPFPMIEVFRSNGGDPERKAVVESLAPRFVDFLSDAIATTVAAGGARIDPSPFIEAAGEEHGEVGREIAIELATAVNEHLFQSPFNSIRRVEWEDIRELDELFTSERLASPHGEYFDQRFVNFLAENFDDIDNINWRQFEGLAAEFFGRLGFAVKIGPGRNDGGVDIRLWPSDEAAANLPAAVLVQCKRERRKISKTVVKSLWADMQAEHAESGLVVTTTALSPGVRDVRTARGYAIEEADRATLRHWIDEMRTPGTGIFLGQ
jgi:restriction system protein